MGTEGTPKMTVNPTKATRSIYNSKRRVDGGCRGKGSAGGGKKGTFWFSGTEEYPLLHSDDTSDVVLALATAFRWAVGARLPRGHQQQIDDLDRAVGAAHADGPAGWRPR